MVAPIAVPDNYFGRWVSRDGDLRIAVTIRRNGTTTVDYQDNGDDPRGFALTNHHRYDADAGLIKLKRGRATLLPDGSIYLVYAYPEVQLNIDRVIPRDTQPRPHAIAAQPPQPRPSTTVTPAAGKPVVAKPPPAPNPAIEVIDGNTIRLSSPGNGWPKSEWASVRIAMLKPEFVRTDTHVMLKWGKDFNELTIAVGMTRAMARKMGMAAKNKYQNVDVVSTRTHRGEDGVIVCANQFRKGDDRKHVTVGASLAYFYLDDWKDADGRYVLRLPERYCFDQAVAKVFLCDRSEKVIDQHEVVLPPSEGQAKLPRRIEAPKNDLAPKSPQLLQLEDKIKRAPVEFLAVYREASAILKRENRDGSFTYSPRRNQPDLEITLPAPAPDEVMTLIDSRLRGFTAGEVPHELRGVWCGRGDKPGATAVHAGEVWKQAMSKVFGGAGNDANSGRK